jgi:hypothetical protein
MHEIHEKVILINSIIGLLNPLIYYINFKALYN